MMLTDATVAEFDAGDRQRGLHRAMLENVRFLHVEPSGARAVVSGSRGGAYRVVFDFTSVDDLQLGVHCDCPRFGDGFPCKHVWATMVKFDLMYDSPIDDASELELVHVDPDDLVIGESRVKSKGRNDTNPIDSRSANRSRSKRTSGNPSKPKEVDWRNQLSRVTELRNGQPAETSLGLPAELLPDSMQRSQHWFVFSVSQRANEGDLQIIAMRSTRKLDGDWGRPVAVELTPTQWGDLCDDREREAFALLQPVEEYSGYARYGYRRPGNRLFSVAPELLQKTLTAMLQSGRLAWKLGDSKQHFEDARPVDEASIEAFSTVRLRIAPDPEKPSQLVLSPELIVPNVGVSPIEQVIWVSDIGCGLIQMEAHDASQEGADQSSEPSVRTCLILLAANGSRLIRAWQETKSIRVPRRSLPALLAELSQSQGNVDLEVDESLGIPERTEVPLAKCFLQQHEPRAAMFSVSLSAKYPDREIAFDSPIKWWFDAPSKTIQSRDWDGEREWLSQFDFNEFGFSIRHDSQQVQLPPDRFLHFVDTLRQAGWEVTANGAPIRVASDFDIQVTSGVDWFDLDAEVSFDDFNASLPALLEAFNKGQQTIVLDDGTVGMLPTQWLSKFVSVQDIGQSVDGSIRFHRSQGMLLDLLLEEHEGVQRDRDYSKFLRELKSFDGIKPATPHRSFSGEMREYQRTGLGWLRFLQKFGFGGCLADEMGLGKTIQILALLDARRKRRVAEGQPRNPSIVVVPKSLVFNWLDESAKFTPKLRVHNHTGTERKAAWDALVEDPESIDVLLTTYGTMRIDAPLLAQFGFDYAILDEAQAIKNPKSLVARASRLLYADHRLAMTGTPVENHLGDLWSLFDFLNPGMLANAGSTARLPDMEDPSQRRKVEKIGQSLRPFILRRTKSEVLTELPEKVEQTLACSMDKKQRSLYDELREHYRVHLSNKVKELGLKKAKIHVLEALLRLRQAACDPRLVNPDCGVRGTKIDELLQRLEELRADGQKTLVFSQFTSLLGLLKQDLDQRGWNYEYLDGKTRRRGEKVARFQSDPECQLFLISLKAGGNGLNLTAAEYVFILDPWWNPAVESQAIDRAHRMGQTQSVNAYRMICRNTVEEKIVELQKSKRDLADAIVSQNKSLIGRLTAEDLQELLG